MTILLAFVAGAVCAALLILLTRRGAGTASMPALAELQQPSNRSASTTRATAASCAASSRGSLNQQEQLARQTGQLSEALRRPGVRGQWGETTLRQVVEAAGLADHFDFSTQTHIAGDGDLAAARPDLVVHLPGDGSVPVDAKVPLDAYLDAAGADDPVVQDRALDEHVKQVRAKVRDLASKAYWSRFERRAGDGRDVHRPPRRPLQPPSSATRCCSRTPPARRS